MTSGIFPGTFSLSLRDWCWFGVMGKPASYSVFIDISMLPFYVTLLHYYGHYYVTLTHPRDNVLPPG